MADVTGFLRRSEMDVLEEFNHVPSHTVGTETGFAKLFRWSWDLNPILKYPIPDLEIEFGRNRPNSDITFLGREICRIYRSSFSKFLDKKRGIFVEKVLEAVWTPQNRS